MSTAAWAAVALLGVAVVAGVSGARARAPRRGERMAPYRAGSARAPDGAAWTPHRGPRWLRRWRRTGADPRPGPTGAAPAGSVASAVDANDQLRARQLAQAGVGAAAGVALGGAVLRSPVMTVLLAACGAAVGFTRAPARAAHALEQRRTTMRLELVTIDQVLAIHVRAGAGPVQAVTRVVDRGSGTVVEELRAVLGAIRAGRGEVEAFRVAAAATPEPHAARTYRLFALVAEQGADLGVALRALSDDLRDVRRDELRRQATRRRAAMLVPTIAVLAPIMLLFVIAPLPSLVLSGR